jgi:hypothetical protein
VVGLVNGAAPVDDRVETDDWRMDAARVGRAGGEVSGPGLSFSRGREEAEVMRAKTPESGRLLLAVPALVVALLVVRVALGGALGAVPDAGVCRLCPLTGNLLGDTLRSPISPPPPPVVSGLVLVGLRSERARDRALVDVVDDMAPVSGGPLLNARSPALFICELSSRIRVSLVCGCD